MHLRPRWSPNPTANSDCRGFVVAYHWVMLTNRSLNWFWASSMTEEVLNILHGVHHHDCKVQIFQEGHQTATHFFRKLFLDWLLWKHLKESHYTNTLTVHVAPEDSSRLTLLKPVWFIQQTHGDFRTDLIIHIFAFVSHSAFWEKALWSTNEESLSQEMFCIAYTVSSGIIVLCVSVAHFSFILMLCCTQMTDSYITCKGLFSSNPLAEVLRWGPERRMTSAEKCLLFAFNRLAQCGRT